MKNLIKKLMSKLKSIKGLKNNGSFILTIALVIGILVVLNFISYQIFARVDLTENRDYSISKISRRTVADLDDVLNIKVYFSKNLPPKFLNLEQEIKDILEEYRNYSGGKVKVTFTDPSTLENPVEELSALGIPPLQFNVMRNDSYEIVQGFMGMLVQYGDGQEAVPMIDSSQNLEYTITTIIKKLSADKKMTVGLVSSNGTIDLSRYAGRAYKSLSDLYNLRTVDLSNEEETLDDIDTLIMPGPREPFEEAHLKKLDEFVMSGRPFILLMDGVVITQQTGPIRNKIGIDDLLNKYGIKVDKNLIADVSNAKASIPSGFFNLVIDYPLWPKVTKDNFNKDNVMVASLESLTLPWASNISVVEENIDSEAQVSILAKTTGDACAQNTTFNIDPQAKTTDCSETAQYNLAVSIVGKIKSAFEEGKTADGRIIVVADSDFPTDQFFGYDSDNVVFFQNLVDGVTLDDDLIGIRSQGITERPLKKLSKGAKETIRYANIFGMTVLVLIFGVSRYFLRRRKKSF